MIKHIVVYESAKGDILICIYMDLFINLEDKKKRKTVDGGI